MGKNRLKTFLWYALVQAAAFVVLVYNIRVIAKGDVAMALATDFVYAILFFTLVRKISHENAGWPAMWGYVLGSLIGTWLGMVIPQ